MRSLPLFLSLLLGTSGCASLVDHDASGDVAAGDKSSTDTDGDGYSEATGDCDETNVNINPGEAEICDGVDNDCDGLTDDADPSSVGTRWVWDGDNDGYGEELDDGTANDEYACDVEAAFAQLVENTGGDVEALENYIPGTYDGEGELLLDCDDEDASVHPYATETCDGVDQDCDGSADDGASDTDDWYVDADNDGYGSMGSTPVNTCTPPAGYVATDDDCDDTSASVNPGMAEVCDEADIDDDCSGSADDEDENATGQTTWYADTDGDMYGDATTSFMACEGMGGYVEDATDCDDTVAATYPGATETCDGVDQDCDGTADDNATDAATWWYDYDGDTYGRSSVAIQSCVAPSGYADRDSDCDDTSASVNPGATESRNGMDDDCDGSTDEGTACTIDVMYFSEGGMVTSFVADASGTSIDGDWAAGVDGVSYSNSSLSGDLWFADASTTAICLEGSDTITFVVTLSDGSSGCELGTTASGSLYALQDGVDLLVSDQDVDDDGDGFADRCVLAISL